MQDPLVEFSQLCTTDDEILCLRYHQNQVIIIFTLVFPNVANVINLHVSIVNIFNFNFSNICTT